MLHYIIDETASEKDFFLAQKITDVYCNNHMHYSFEVMIVTEGAVKVTCDGVDIILKKGQGIYIMPFGAHAFFTPEFSKSSVFTFSSSFVKDFSTRVADKKAVCPVFEVSKQLMLICEEFNYSEYSEDPLYLKALLYPLCNEISRKCRFEQSDKNYDSSFIDAVKYINENFTKSISLESTARAVGLNHKYFSRMFKQVSGMCFSDYLSSMRCSFALKMMRDPAHSDKNLSEIAFEAGFGSIRNFNRLFKKFYSISPSEARLKDDNVNN